MPGLVLTILVITFSDNFLPEEMISFLGWAGGGGGRGGGGGGGCVDRGQFLRLGFIKG